MTIYEQWKNSAYTQDGQLDSKVWDSYLPLEQKIYETLLKEKMNVIKGSFKELAKKHGMSDMQFIGFLDGISEALNDSPELSKITKNTPIDAGFEWEALYKKMVEYKAQHLYTLPEWDNVFTEDERSRLYKEQKSSTTYVREAKVGRNDPCPCGSGMKYKKCCGL